MSDAFISSMLTLGVDESIIYVASTKASRDKVKNLAESISSKKLVVDFLQDRNGNAVSSKWSGGEKYRLIITRVQ